MKEFVYMYISFKFFHENILKMLQRSCFFYSGLNMLYKNVDSHFIKFHDYRQVSNIRLTLVGN